MCCSFHFFGQLYHCFSSILSVWYTSCGLNPFPFIHVFPRIIFLSLYKLIPEPDGASGKGKIRIHCGYFSFHVSFFPLILKGIYNVQSLHGCAFQLPFINVNVPDKISMKNQAKRFLLLLILLDEKCIMQVNCKTNARRNAVSGCPWAFRYIMQINLNHFSLPH